MVPMAGCEPGTDVTTGTGPGLSSELQGTSARAASAATTSSAVTIADIVDRGPYFRCKVATDIYEPLVQIDSERQLVRIARTEACAYGLGIRDASGVVQELPVEDGTYYNAATTTHRGRLAIATTRVRTDGWRMTPDGTLVTHDLDTVIEVMVADNLGGWSKPQIVMDLPEATWLGLVTSDDENLRLTFWRDSLFEHLLFTQERRPATDGLYEMHALETQAGEFQPHGVTRIRDYVLRSAHAAGDGLDH